MGNKMCKRKVDSVDNGGVKSQTRFDRIINRLHLKPNAWKSDSQLHEKQRKRTEVNSTNPSDKKIIHTQPLSKSSDWTDVDLEVPDKEQVHLRNPKLSIIFNNENGTPTPPPRKHKKNFREKIEAVAKNGLQAFQSKKLVEEPIMVKKKINYSCPICDQDEASHNRDHHHHHNHNHNPNHKQENKNEKLKSSNPKLEKDKRKKNLSVVSLPNYDDLKLTVASFDEASKVPSASERQKTSLTSIPNDNKKPLTGSTGKLDTYITRCRSFGSLLPQQLKKLKLRSVPPDVESDDSFGALEDWDLGLIEHYNPKDASLPRPRKEQRKSKDIVTELESLIVKEEDLVDQTKPKPPVRRSESLVKKINREAAQTAQDQNSERTRLSKSPTPPPSPVPKPATQYVPRNLPTVEDGKVEHSSLMKILEQFSIRDKQTNQDEGNDLEKNVNSIQDFIHAEKVNTDRDLNFGKSQQGLVS